MFKALTWIWLSKVNEPALPKKRWIKVDKVPPEKNGSERELLTIEAHPPFTRYAFIFVFFFTIESQDTNRYTTLFWLVTGEVEFRIVGGLTMKDRWFFKASKRAPIVWVDTNSLWSRTYKWRFGEYGLYGMFSIWGGIICWTAPSHMKGLWIFHSFAEELRIWFWWNVHHMDCFAKGVVHPLQWWPFATVKSHSMNCRKTSIPRLFPLFCGIGPVFLRFDTAWLIIVWFEMGISDFDGLSLFSPWPLP